MPSGINQSMNKISFQRPSHYASKTSCSSCAIYVVRTTNEIYSFRNVFVENLHPLPKRLNRTPDQASWWFYSTKYEVPPSS